MDWYTSALNYDMSNGRVDSMMNIQFNQFVTDSIARANLYAVPMFSLNTYSYTTPSVGLGYLTDPYYAFGQWSYNNSRIGAQNFASGENTSPWANFTGSYFGYTQGTQNGGNAGGNSSPEEAAVRTKISKLYSLLNQIAKSSVLGDEKTAELKETLRTYTKEKDVKEQYKALKEAYDKIDKAIVKDFMKQVELSDKKADKLSVLLTAAGYEQESSIDDEIGDIISTFNDITKSNVTPEGNDVIATITGKLESADYQILDLISSWKSSDVVKNTGVDKNIMQFIIDKYNKDELEKAQKDKIFDLGIKPLTNALLDKAKETMNTKIDNKYVLDEASRSDIKTLRDAVDTNLTLKDFSSLAENFDKLYATLRRAEALIINTKVNTYYSFLEDEQVFNKDLFQKETEEDLEAEGMINKGLDVNLNSQVKNGNVAPQGAENSGNAGNNEQVINELTEEQTATLKEALGDKYTLGEEVTVYLVKSGLDNKQTVVIKKDGKFYRLPVTFDGTNFTVADNADFTTLTETTEEEIKGQYTKESNIKKSTKALDELTTGSNAVLKKVEINGKTCYIETTATGKSGARVFIVDAEGKIREYKNNSISEEEVSVDEIKKSVRQAKSHNDSVTGAKLTEDELKTLNSDVKKVRKALSGRSSDEDYKTVNDTLGILTDKESLAFAYIYNSEYKEGIFTQIMSEWHHGRQAIAQKLANKILAFIDKNRWAWEGDERKENTIKNIQNDFRNIEYRTDGKVLDTDVKTLVALFKEVMPNVK